MSTGAGRGRGWLNLRTKDSESPRPGVTKAGISNVANRLEIKEEHRELIKRVGQLSEQDDGIKFNAKLKPIYEFWMEECRSKEDVEESFASLYKASAHDKDLASKLLILLASPAAQKFRFYECQPRFMFLQHLQNDFESRNELQDTDSNLFRNVVYMLSEYFCKVELGNKLSQFLSQPLLTCFDMLLMAKTVQDVRQLAIELYRSGQCLNNSNAERLFLFSTKVRLTLLDGQLHREVKLWLLFIIDLMNNKFNLLPGEILKFYEEQLGATAMDAFHNEMSLSVQTILPTSEMLENYQSDNVNVLQISSSSAATSPNNDAQDFLQNSGNFNSKDCFSGSNNKAGRPILGAGARYSSNGNNNKLNKDENSEWNNKKEQRNHQNSNKGRSGSGAPQLKSNRGWEHDDRFDNDYN